MDVPSEPKPSLQEMVWTMGAAYEAMMDEQAKMRRAFDLADKRMKEIALELYPHMGEWSAESLRKVDDVISRAADSFCYALAEADAAPRS